MFNISFRGKPNNYLKIDNTVSRSAQPKIEDFKWLKEEGVTDIVNFRTMFDPGLEFDEKKVVEEQGMKYHNIQSYTRYPKEENIGRFLDIVDKVKESGGKVHIHCKAGADRTGMYAWIYKQKNGIGSMKENEEEMLKMGHHNKLFPNLINWIKKFIKYKNY